jgi:ABC-type transporter Mla subunit MlaD
VLTQLARALVVVRSFVSHNKSALRTNVEQLTTTVRKLARQKDALITVLEKGPLGIGNLSVAYDVPSGSIGARIQMGPTPANFGNFLCGVAANSGVKDPAVCTLLKQLTAPLGKQMPNIGAGPRQTPRVGNNRPAGSFSGLLGGAG